MCATKSGAPAKIEQTTPPHARTAAATKKSTPTRELSEREKKTLHADPLLS